MNYNTTQAQKNRAKVITHYPTPTSPPTHPIFSKQRLHTEAYGASLLVCEKRVYYVLKEAALS